MTIPFIDLQAQYRKHQQKIDDAVSKVLQHGQYIMGPEVRELETVLADYLGVKHALACSSGTDALVLPLMTKSLSKTDAVFTSPFTFFASAESISLAGGTPVFVDIDPHTYNLDPHALEEKIKEVLAEGKLQPAGVMPVDIFGLSADYNAINPIAEKYGLFVIEDAAQSFGAPYHGKKAGALADVAGTSFYPAKPLGCYGDGGAVFTNDSDMYEQMVSLRVHGQATSGDKYDNVRIGINGRMDTIQAAILLEKIKHYDDELASRNKVAERYREKLVASVKTPQLPEGQGSVWAQYSIQVDDRTQLQADLKSLDIPTAVFYPIPIHLSTAYQFLGHKAGDFPVSEAISHKIISLPMHPFLDEGMIDKICSAVNHSVDQ